jgi:5'-3' exonuclease
MNRAYLIDCSIYFFRYYFSELPSRLSESGREVSSVLAFTQWLLRFLESENPKYIAACFDESLGTCFRNDIDPDYKANRALPDESLAFELLAIKKVCELMGLPTYASDRYEADDLIASLAHHARAKKYQVSVVSRDKDLGQLLLSEQDELWDAPKGQRLTANDLQSQFGVKPTLIADFLAIVGDPVDNIYGVPGIGKKTAAALLQSYDSWQELKQQLELVAKSDLRGAKRISFLLEEYRDIVDQNLKLTKLHDQCVPEKSATLERGEIQRDALLLLLESFNFPPSIYKRAVALDENYRR